MTNLGQREPSVAVDGRLRCEARRPWLEDYELVEAAIITERVKYIIDDIEIVVPLGFTTDGASVPRPLRWAVPAHWRTFWAAVLHDYLIRNTALHPTDPWRNDKAADEIFFRVLRFSGIGPLSARRMYWAVRLGSYGRALKRRREQ